MALDPTVAAKKWANRLSQAASDGTIQAGIQATTVAPGQAAARQKQVWAQNTAASVDRWAANTAAVSLPEWQAAMTNKALPRMAQGATEAEPKMAQFLSKLAPVIANAKNSLPARGTFQQNLQRANAMATALHNAKGSFK